MKGIEKIMTINEKTENNIIYLEIALCDREFNDYFVRCEDCGTIVFKSDAVEIDDEYYCSDCITTCSHCGCAIPLNEVFSVKDSSAEYCHSCYENETYICDDCGEHFRYSDSLTQIDGYSYCNDCIDKHRTLIDDYHTMKGSGYIHFYGEENRSQVPYMGFELEVDTNSYIDRDEVVRKLKDEFGEFFCYENDGSLSRGWENISQPASLNYHLSMMDRYLWMFETLSECGLKSHDTNTCGFHIHIDREYFGKSEDTAIAKLLYIFEKFRPELMTFSRRSEEQAASWAQKRKYDGNDKFWIKKAVKDSKNYYDHSERYYAVNLTNSQTVEIRLWKGTLNSETFEATLRFTARLAEICKSVSATKLAKMSFEDLLGDNAVICSYWNRVQKRVTTEREF